MQYLQAYLFKHFSSLCVLGLMCSTLLFSYSATAADIAGRIIMARGDVKAVNSEGSIRQLKRRDSIYSHEIIKTGKASKVQIRFIDNALLALKAESELNIKAYVYSTENEEDNQVLMELVAGGFRTLTGKIGKGNKEAYKVETPVASIGIRGTLYDVQLAVDKIFAGVWKGGISLDTPQGQFNLGIGSDFDFGEISASGVFTGLLNPPAAFTPQTPASGSDSNTKDETNDGSSTATDSFSDSNNGNSDNNSDGETNNSPLIDSAAPDTSIPSPFEKDGLPDETIAENDSFIKDENEPNTSIDPLPGSPDSRLSPAEVEQLNTNAKVALLVGDNNQGLAIALNTNGDEQGDLFFLATKVAADGVATQEVIRRGEALDVDFSTRQPWSDQISWGIWQGTSEAPIRRYTEYSDTGFRPIEQDLFYLAGKPASSADLTNGIVAGTLHFSTSSSDLSPDNQTDFIASSNAGVVTNVDAQFDLTSSAGNHAISNISMTVESRNAMADQDSTWNMYAEEGTIEGATITVDHLTGDFYSMSTDSTGSDISAAAVTNADTNTDTIDSNSPTSASGSLSGILLAPAGNSTAIDTFAGAFDLSTDDGVHNAAGVIILKTGQ